MITYEQLEEMRKRLRNKNILIIILFIIFGFVIFSFYIKINFELLLLFLALYKFVSFILTRKDSKKYSLSFKNFFVKSSLIKTFNNLNYQPDCGIDKSIIASTNMMYMGDRYTSNDLITGSYKNIGFTQADVHIEDKRRDSDGDSYYVTLFRGRWMIFDFNKNFKANVQVSQKGFGNNKVKSLFSNDKLKYVEMESEQFNKIFKVYAVEPIDAFYILTPKIMERLMNLDEMNSGKLLLCFVDNKLHVGIYDNKDSFEHGSVFKKIDQEETVSNISEDIKKITMFVDELELDNDLFKIN